MSLLIILSMKELKCFDGRVEIFGWEYLSVVLN